MITIQKSVTASDGGTANNPASPDLSGFVFEIKDSGSVVVDTLTTNSSGTAVSIALPDGDYTVVETDPQGLSDSTGSTGVALDASGKTVNWENRQAALGTITVQKSVTASDDGTANNPASPDLSGFVFEIKDSGSVVVDTLTTNSSGTAVSIALPDGDYTVVETDSQGLSDSTGSTAVALDTSGKIVNWRTGKPNPARSRLTRASRLLTTAQPTTRPAPTSAASSSTSKIAGPLSSTP